MPRGLVLHMYAWAALAGIFMLATFANVTREDMTSATYDGLVALAGYLVFFNFRCPRCLAHLSNTKSGMHGLGSPIPDACVKCGRPKAGTWPFQWALRRERG